MQLNRWEVPEADRIAMRDAALNESRGRPFIVSVSGGKDSTATCLWLRYLEIPYEAVHMDTGWEHPDTDAYVREVLPGHIGEFAIIQSLPDLSSEMLGVAESLELQYMQGKPSSMVRWILKRKTFSSRKSRYCTEELKTFPFMRWADARYPGGAFVNVTGVRAEESSKRAALPEWDMDDSGCLMWRPLIAWLESDVIDIHHVFDVPPNPLYLRGAGRVGCMPCIMSRKAEIRQMAEMMPGRVALIRALELIITDLARDRGVLGARESDGAESFRSFFGNPEWRRQLKPHVAEARAKGMDDTDAKAYAKARVWAMAKIDDVIAWSKTDRKGKDEPFAPLPHEAGCTRWGFCDTSWQDPAGALPLVQHRRPPKHSNE